MNKLKKSISIILSFIMLFSFASCGQENSSIDYTKDYLSSSGYVLKTAVLCRDGGSEITEYLKQSTLLDLTADEFTADNIPDLSGYDVVYVDADLAEDEGGWFNEVLPYVEAGGALFLPNECSMLPSEVYGASELVSAETYPSSLEIPQGLSPDLQELAEIVKDYYELYGSFDEAELLKSQDYGWGIKADGAVSLIKSGKTTLYSINKYGEGLVFYTNPLLPNYYSLGTYSMLGDSAAGYSTTTASFNQLIYSGFAKYVSKLKYGYALEKVYGYFGSPSMNWELHYEEITGIENGSMKLFTDLCEEYGQVPSFTVIRNSYQWFLKAESVSYLLNQAERGSSFKMDLNESAYSSGAHVLAGDRWLMQETAVDKTSYFTDDSEHTLRAYPSVCDFNGDGKPDLFCGSQNGKVYYYEGLGFSDGRFKTGEAMIIDLGEETNSAPCVCDINGDGLSDLAVGFSGGKLKVYYGQNSAKPSFGAASSCETLVTYGDGRQVLPCICDLNGDGYADAVLGSDTGKLDVFYGGENGLFKGLSADAAVSSPDLHFEASELGIDGLWMAPAVTDYYADGSADIVLGTYLGYIYVLNGNVNGFGNGSYIELDERNYKGNFNAKFGNYAVPAFADINGDGSKDLIAGNMEYGMAYPIDDPAFPFRDELKNQIDYVKDKGYYLGVHFYTNAFASAERELWELTKHKKVLEDVYGLDLKQSGTNQHTWYTSSLSNPQSFLSAWKAGLLWNGGFGAPTGFDTPPQYAFEQTVSLPFFLTDEGEETILLQNNAVLLYTVKSQSEYSAKYRMPMSLFYHCDFIYQGDTGARGFLEQANEFRWEHGYNFCMENQTMLASAAAINQVVNVEGNLIGGDAKLTSAQKKTDYPLYDEDAAGSLGLRLCFADYIDPGDYSFDADIWFKDGSDVVIGLGKDTVRVGKNANGESADSSGLLQVNCAADISADEGGAKIEFLSGGMMCAVVSGAASTESEGWKTESVDGKTVFTKYGSAETLNVEWK